METAVIDACVKLSGASGEQRVERVCCAWEGRAEVVVCGCRTQSSLTLNRAVRRGVYGSPSPPLGHADDRWVVFLTAREAVVVLRGRARARRTTA